MKKKPKRPPTSPGLIIALFVSPFVLLLAFMGWRLTYWDEEIHEARAEQRLYQQRASAVAGILNENGASLETSSAGTAIITLPDANATPVQAKEIALTAHSRLGKPVRVKTPAGQTLAEAP